MDTTAIISALRAEGARFAYLFGSAATGDARAGSDIDVAAWFGDVTPPPWERASRMPPGVDLLVLDDAPLELAGRVAHQGRLLFDADPPARVEWEATTRKIYSDETYRVEEARRVFLEGAEARGRR